MPQAPAPATTTSPTSSPAAVVSKAVVRAARLLGLNNAALADVIGLSEATVSRLAAGKYTLDWQSKSYELALLLVRLYRSLDAMVGSEEKPLRAWMRSRNLALEAVPVEQIRTIPGLVEVVAYVDSARARI